MPVGCVDDGLVQPVGCVQCLYGAHGGVAVDVYDVSFVDGLGQWQWLIIIMEQAGVDGGQVFNRERLKFRVVLKHSIEVLAVIVSAARFVLTNIEYFLHDVFLF